MGAAVLRPVLFPAPPASYTMDSCYPDLELVPTRQSSTIPVCVAVDRALHRPEALSILFSHGNREDLGSFAMWLVHGACPRFLFFFQMLTRLISRAAASELDAAMASYDYTG